MRNCLVPGDKDLQREVLGKDTLVSDHVLESRKEELACEELAAIAAQVLLSSNCIIVQFYNSNGRCGLFTIGRKTKRGESFQ